MEQIEVTDVHSGVGMSGLELGGGEAGGARHVAGLVGVVLVLRWSGSLDAGLDLLTYLVFHD